MKLFKKYGGYIIGAAIIIALIVLPKIMFAGADLMGTDDAANGAVESIAKGYTPWANTLLDLSDSAEKILFALQWVMGACLVVIPIAVIYKKSKKKAASKTSN